MKRSIEALGREKKLKILTNIQQKLKDYSRIDPDTGCWLWQRSLSPGGYGYACYKGKTHYAHRLSYQIFVGEIPKGLCVRHRCHTSVCVNPDHLGIGTHQDNANDKVKAGRIISQVGEKNYQAKLTWPQVRFIRANIQDGRCTQKDMIKLFEVSQPAISDIVRGRNWKEQHAL